MLLKIFVVLLLLVLSYFKLTSVTGGRRSYTGTGIWFVIIMWIAGLSALGSFTILNSQEIGLKSTAGNVGVETLTSGLNFKMPFVQDILVFPSTAQTVDLVIPVSKDGAITKDNQTVGASVKVTYHYEKKNLSKMYRTFGIEKIKERLVSQTEQEFKVEIGKYGIFEIAEKQDMIREPITKRLEVAVAEKLGGTIIIENVNVLNYDWSPEFDAEIKTTMAKTAQVKQKAQDLLIAEQEAQKEVKKAEATKQALILTSEGEKIAAENRAEAKKAEGLGVKAYNESIAANQGLQIELTKLKIEEARVARWNGVYVPNNMYGPIPFNSIGGVKGE
jgi:regulator of protease activity HflC (stomatin/prohibitin superfamily)